MTLKIKTPPAVEPLSLSEAKAYLRITDANDDILISAMITAVRRRCEEYTKRALIAQTWTLWLDKFPRNEAPQAPKDGYFEVPLNQFDVTRRSIDVPRPPLISVAFLKTYDVADVAAVFSPANYLVDTASEPGRIALNFSQTWPLVLRWYNAVQVEFVAGYGDTGASVPDDLKQGMLFLLKAMFAGKTKAFEPDETHSLAGLSDKRLPEIVAGLWNPYRIIGL